MNDTGTAATILLAEDEPQIRVMIRDVLVSQGYNVITAANGQEALEEFSADPAAVHLLVTDIVMPGMDGVASYKKMKRINPGLKVIFISGYLENLPPYVQIILKPFHPFQLLQMVRKVLDEKPLD